MKARFFVLLLSAILIPALSIPAAEAAPPNKNKGGNAPARSAAPRNVQPHVTRQSNAPRFQNRTPPRTVVAPSRVRPNIAVKPNTNVVRPNTFRPNVVRPGSGPANVNRAVTASRLRGLSVSGAGSATVRGRNYSAWRSNYRVRRGGGWRTFVALSTLGALAFGSGYLYPYAYISAPQPYCDGFTEDGCQLQWRDVETVEGDVIGQCVAYCPWQ